MKYPPYLICSRLVIFDIYYYTCSLSGCPIAAAHKQITRQCTSPPGTPNQRRGMNMFTYVLQLTVIVLIEEALSRHQKVISSNLRPKGILGTQKFESYLPNHVTSCYHSKKTSFLSSVGNLLARKHCYTHDVVLIICFPLTLFGLTCSFDDVTYLNPTTFVPQIY